jgi:hypothetical protein
MGGPSVRKKVYKMGDGRLAVLVGPGDRLPSGVYDNAYRISESYHHKLLQLIYWPDEEEEDPA